jgi:hypothetical protein
MLRPARWLLAGCSLAARWLLAGCSGCSLAPRRLLAGSSLAARWLLRRDVVHRARGCADELTHSKSLAVTFQLDCAVFDTGTNGPNSNSGVTLGVIEEVGPPHLPPSHWIWDPTDPHFRVIEEVGPPHLPPSTDPAPRCTY